MRGAPHTMKAISASPVPPPAPTDLAAILGDLRSTLADLFECIEWAEDEIQRACAHHPEAHDRLYHSFSLLTPSFDRMSTEFVHRAHCAELLDRVAAGADTRPGTAAEVCCALMAASLKTPLRSSAVGLYMRMWDAAGFPPIEEFSSASGHHEALEGSVIDDHEQFARRKLADDARRLGTISCPGRHHGEDVTCMYAPAARLAAGT